MPDLSGKVALVTGAARGIGRAIALELARGGADLVLCDLDTPHDWPMLEETGQLVRERGRDVLLQPCDVTVSRQVDELFAAALARFGRVDALVNNAGSSLGPDPVNNPQGLGVDIADTDDEYWRFFIDQNLTSAYYCCRAYVRAYRQAGLRSGSIVNMSSVAALIGANVGPAYTRRPRQGCWASPVTWRSGWGGRGYGSTPSSRAWCAPASPRSTATCGRPWPADYLCGVWPSRRMWPLWWPSWSPMSPVT